jgi:hypothetical protein
MSVDNNSFWVLQTRDTSPSNNASIFWCFPLVTHIPSTFSTIFNIITHGILRICTNLYCRYTSFASNCITSELDIEFESTGRGRLIYIMNRSTRSLYIKGDPVWCISWSVDHTNLFTNHARSCTYVGTVPTTAGEIYSRGRARPGRSIRSA